MSWCMYMCLRQCQARSDHSVIVSNALTSALLLSLTPFVSWTVGLLRVGKFPSLSFYSQSPSTMLGTESPLIKCVLSEGLASLELIWPQSTYEIILSISARQWYCAFSMLCRVNTAERKGLNAHSMVPGLPFCLPNGGQVTTPPCLLPSHSVPQSTGQSPTLIMPHRSLTLGPKLWWMWLQGWGEGTVDVPAGHLSPFSKEHLVQPIWHPRGKVSVYLWMGPLLLLLCCQRGGKCTMGLRNNESAYIFFLPKKPKAFP